MDTSQFLSLVHDGWISNYPLAVGSIVTLSVFFERLWRHFEGGVVPFAQALRGVPESRLHQMFAFKRRRPPSAPSVGCRGNESEPEHVPYCVASG